MRSDNMTLLEVGRVCIKKYGRDAGCRAVITAVEGNGFVKIATSERTKDRKCNPAHLEFLNEKIDPANKELLMKTLGVTEKKAPAKAQPAPAKGKVAK
jgi:ribosomal protein L14E/L6E/L27E